MRLVSISVGIRVVPAMLCVSVMLVAPVSGLMLVAPITRLMIHVSCITIVLVVMIDSRLTIPRVGGVIMVIASVGPVTHVPLPYRHKYTPIFEPGGLFSKS